jgi:hypothetical protein
MEFFYLLECKAVLSVTRTPAFRRHILFPSSGFKSKSGKKPAWNIEQDHRSYLRHAGFLPDLLFSLADEGDMFVGNVFNIT